MDVILKHELSFDGLTRIAPPLGAVPVFVAMQNGDQHIWIRQSNTAQSPRKRAFQIVATGKAFLYGETHVGTIQDGRYIWHVLEVL